MSPDSHISTTRRDLMIIDKVYFGLYKVANIKHDYAYTR